MELSQIVSPTYSVSSNMLKLNSSSIASSTPGCSRQGPLIAFEQFEQSQHSDFNGRPSLPKKHLTIEIEEDYNYQPHEHANKEERLPQISVPTPESEVEFYHNNEHMRMFKTYEQEIQLWKIRFEESEASKKDLVVQNQQLQDAVKKKDQQILHQQKVNNDFVHKLAQFEEQEAKDRYYDEKMREKQAKYKDFQKIHDKVVAMNKSLQRQLRDNQKKIMQLQRQVQRSVCTTQQENLQKIKQSSIKLKQSTLKISNHQNKENALNNVVKSIDRKKCANSTGHSKKSVRISSSSTNIQRKLQIKNSLI